MAPPQVNVPETRARQTGLDQRSRGRLALAAVSVALLWLWGSPVLWPLSIAVVFAHEASHALMTVLTGGDVVQLSLGMNEGGETVSSGGIRFLILNAGYLGSLLSGIALLSLVRWSRTVCMTIGLVSLGVAIVWMPWLSFGFAWTLVWAACLCWVGVRSPAWLPSTVVRLYGVYSVLYAFGDIRSDVFGAPVGSVTDASMLAELTGVPAMVWGVGWMALGAMAVWWNRKWV